MALGSPQRPVGARQSGPAGREVARKTGNVVLIWRRVPIKAKLPNEKPLFARVAEDYLKAGLRVLPVGREDGKTPLVRGFMKAKDSTRRTWIPKFPRANIAVIDGHKITRIDVDDPDLIGVAIDRFGDTPIKVATPSGGMHLWYKNRGERRKVRLDGEKIDVLGRDGYGLVPPSKTSKGQYRFAEGGLKLIDQLPFIRDGALPPEVYGKTKSQQLVNGDTIPEGFREAALFAEARRVVGIRAHGRDELSAHLMRFNDEKCRPPLPKSQVIQKAQHVWEMFQRRDVIRPGDGRKAILGIESILELSEYPAAFVLWAYLTAYHAPHHQFVVVSDGIAQVLGMSRNTIWKARNWLVKRGNLVLIHKQSRIGDPNVYCFGPKHRAQ